MTHPRPTTQQAWWRFLLAAIAAVLVGLLSAGTASAATLPNLETRVGASPATAAYIVGTHQSISAGQHRVHAPPNAQIASATGVAAKGGARALEPVAGGGARLASITSADQSIIQAAATRVGKPISVVGSRSTGAFGPSSDWDYVVQGLTKEEAATLRKALPSTYAGIGEPPLIDIFSGEIASGAPYITFFPKG